MDLVGVDFVILISLLIFLNFFVLFVCKYKIIFCKIFMKYVFYYVLLDIKVKFYRFMYWNKVICKIFWI